MSEGAPGNTHAMSYTVERANALDTDSLLELLDGANAIDEKVQRYRDRIATTLENGGHMVVVARSGKAVVGYAAAQDYGPAAAQRGSVARIHDLWVDPSARNQGIGAALFAAVRAWAESETRIEFLQWQSSATAAQFYAHLGLQSHSGPNDQPKFEIDVHLPGRRS
ncbi:N-acetyltransferase family protein [Humidisolicoccus flavus]|uniref:GNAT family N-acetyltransferase n=1 Tax=Humidisolicoccus flavus TaxID=3111414 RepID=UPI00324C7550